MCQKKEQQLKMEAFIRDLFDEFYPDCGDIDGGTLQNLAEKHGILVPEICHEPCGESCNCAEMCDDEEWKAGVQCYRLANWLSEAKPMEGNVIAPERVAVTNLVRAANGLLYFRQGIIAKEFDKFSPTLCGALHDLSMAVKAVEQRIQTEA